MESRAAGQRPETGELHHVKRWTGRWLLAVGALHTAFGLAVFREQVALLARSGPWNALADHPESELAFWFILSGWLMVLAGGLADALEGQGVAPPHWFAGGLLAVVLVGLILMPVSGFWLLLPPAVGALRRRSPHRSGAPG
jgi:Family of unknown function (DUF6463)